jgi:hypothetical protein
MTALSAFFVVVPLVFFCFVGVFKAIEARKNRAAARVFSSESANLPVAV